MNGKAKLLGAKNRRANTVAISIFAIFTQSGMDPHAHTHTYTQLQVDIFKENISYCNNFLDIVAWWPEISRSGG